MSKSMMGYVLFYVLRSAKGLSFMKAYRVLIVTAVLALAVGAHAETAGNRFVVGSAVALSTGAIEVPLTLSRAGYAAGAPASLSCELRYDTTVLEFAGSSSSELLDLWYGKDLLTNEPIPGVVRILVVGFSMAEITTCDDQRSGGTGEQINPFPLGTLLFEVVGAPGTVSALTAWDLSMPDASAEELVDSGADHGSIVYAPYSASLFAVVLDREKGTFVDAAQNPQVRITALSLTADRDTLNPWFVFPALGNGTRTVTGTADDYEQASAAVAVRTDLAPQALTLSLDADGDAQPTTGRCGANGKVAYAGVFLLLWAAEHRRRRLK